VIDRSYEIHGLQWQSRYSIKIIEIVERDKSLGREHDCAPLMITKKIDNFHEIHGLKWRLLYSIEIIEFVEFDATNGRDVV
jgi:hypothetical protein